MAYRNLVITSPHTTGDDVGLLQHAIKRLSAPGHYDLPQYTGGDFEDKELGKLSLDGARDVGYYLGAPDLQLHGPIRPHLQIIIRATWRRTPAEFARGKRRYIERRRYLLHHRGVDGALAWCEAQVRAKVHEQPSGSNRGPQVSAYQHNFGIDGAPWCGAFVGTAMIEGGLRPSQRIVYVPYIAADYPHVAYGKRKAGDLVCFNFGGGLQHVGMLADDLEHTYEGNTSPGAGGSQDNGGVVAYRLRDRSTMAAIVRPSWH